LATSPGKGLPYEASVPLAPFLLKPFAAVLLLLALWWRWPAVEQAIDGRTLGNLQKLEQDLPLILLLAGLTFLFSRLGQAYAQFHLGHRPPRLVRQIIAGAAWLIGIGITVGMLWDVPVGSLMTTSGLLVAVIGIALKNMISDLVNGITLPVKVGDWVEVAGLKGRVIEISWRATKLLHDQTTITIPNTHFISHPIRNFSPEGGFYIDTVRIVLPLTVTAYQAERILVGAAHQIEAVARLPNIPEARIIRFTDAGVEWELRFPVPDGRLGAPLRHQVQRAMLRDLYYSGIELPAAQVQLHRPIDFVAPEREEMTFLSHIDLFGTLTHDELMLVCNRMRPRLIQAGNAVVRQGDSGDSLFIVQEGLLVATIGANGAGTEVGRIRPGQFFGEMSLLTGAARSATVTPMVDSKVYEVDREIIAPILQDRPEIAALMSRVLAERELANAPKLATPTQMVDARDSLAQQLLGHITAFFRLPSRPSREATI
jgi:small-conductance mechanosensitive channel/CRP-like cAMP-binding protein